MKGLSFYLHFLSTLFHLYGKGRDYKKRLSQTIHAHFEARNVRTERKN